MVNQNTHEETMEIVENVIYSNIEIKEEPLDYNDLRQKYSNREGRDKTFSLVDKIDTKPYKNNESDNQGMEMTDNQSIQSSKFKCESYSKSFSQVGDLKKHVYTILEGHKHQKCESCGRSFSQAGDLKIHIHTVHEGHKKHICESCGKSFSQAGNLKTHISTVHEGQKNHRCESCDKSFSKAQYLKTHILTIH